MPGQQEKSRLADLDLLSRVAVALTNVTDLGASLHMVARELTQVFNTRGSTVTLIDERREDAEVVAEFFNDPALPSVMGLKVPLDTPAWQRLAEERRAIVIERPDEDSLLGSVRDVMRERQVAQLLVAPLFARGVLIGNMSVSHEPGRSFAPGEVMLAQTLAGAVAQAVDNARLYSAAREARERAEAVSRELEDANRELARLSITDALTGIPNRRRFHEVLDEEWRRAQRQGNPIAVMMIDVDSFKSYNDEYGHQHGDTCLASVAAALQGGLLRAGEFFGRYGGDEFVVILPNADDSTVRNHADRLCARVRDLALPHARSPVAKHATVSIGCAATVPESGATPERLIAAADGALYEAKRAGRNRVGAAQQGVARAATGSVGDVPS
jgi:diguanylate cyclase (GGDEF)-like protein